MPGFQTAEVSSCVHTQDRHLARRRMARNERSAAQNMTEWLGRTASTLSPTKLGAAISSHIAQLSPRRLLAVSPSFVREAAAAPEIPLIDTTASVPLPTLSKSPSYDAATSDTACHASAPPSMQRSLRPRASSEPPEIPSEVREWMKAQKKPTGPKRRRRAKSPAEARIKLRRLGICGTQREQKVPTGSIIHLFGMGMDATVIKFDPISLQYQVRIDDGRVFSELLHGSNGVACWDLIREPAPEPAADAAAAVRTSARLHVESCPICLEVIDDDRGVMPCCGVALHKTCQMRWRNSNLTSQPLNRSIRSGKEAGPNTLLCCWCKEPCASGASTISRIFGEEA